MEDNASTYYKTICSNCAGKSLGSYIAKNANQDECSYCKKYGDNIAMTISDVLKRMYKSWELYFSNFDDSSFSEEFRTRYYLSDIVDDEIAELEDANEQFISDLRELPEYDKVWQKDSEYWTDFSNALKFSWDNFARIVKHRWRYTFFLCDNSIDAPTSYSPIDTLSRICELIERRQELLYTLPTNTPIYRARRFSEQQKFCAKDLGTVPAKYAKENRFNPKGIPLFYGSFDKETCTKEASGEEPVIVIGEFCNSKAITLLDLTNIPNVPYLYDDDYGFIPVVQFLHEFSKIISQPTGENAELEYIPTQVFTEYIRRNLHELNLKGIKYQSAENPNGKNLVLFYTNDECIAESNYDGMSDRLILKKVL